MEFLKKESNIMKNCPSCNTKLEVTYHVFAWDDENNSSDIFVNNYREAKELYVKALVDEPDREWRMLRDKYCSNCCQFQEEDEYLHSHDGGEYYD